MPPGHDTFRATRFFASLDGLRAVSILAVIWLHCWVNTPQFAWLGRVPVLRDGHRGVDVFFAVSGFLITTLLVRERARFGNVSLRNFYLRRALRIWPLYYAVLALYVAVVLATQRHAEQGRSFLHYLPGYLTYTYTWFDFPAAAKLPPFNFAWSLSTEEQFYVFWPLAMVLLGRSWDVVALVGLLAVRVAAEAGVGPRLWMDAGLAHRVLMSVSVPICLGAVLARVLDRPRGFAAARAVLGRRGSAAGSLAVLIVAIGVGPERCPPLYWAGLVALVGSCVVREDNGLRPLLSLRPLALVGAVSYGMYLFNTLVILCLRPVLHRAGIRHPVLVFPFAAAATVGVAWVSFRYFESPILGLKRRFTRDPAAARPVPTL